MQAGQWVSLLRAETVYDLLGHADGSTPCQFSVHSSALGGGKPFRETGAERGKVHAWGAALASGRCQLPNLAPKCLELLQEDGNLVACKRCMGAAM